MMAEPENTVSASSVDQLSNAVLLSAVTSEQGGKTVKNVHQVPRLSGRALQISSFNNDLMKHPHAPLHLVKHDRQVQS